MKIEGTGWKFEGDDGKQNIGSIRSRWYILLSKKIRYNE